MKHPFAIALVFLGSLVLTMEGIAAPPPGSPPAGLMGSRRGQIPVAARNISVEQRESMHEAWIAKESLSPVVGVFPGPLQLAASGDSIAQEESPSHPQQPEEAGAATMSMTRNYLPRVDFGQHLEPKGNRIIHGAGALAHSDWSSVLQYRQLMIDRPPLALMSWLTLRHAPPPFYDQWRELLRHLPPVEQPIAQVGLNFNLNENPDNNFEDAVAAGDYDKEIRRLFLDIKRLGIPVLLRVGLAFNASFHNYAPGPFKEAFRRVWRIMNQTETNNVALVWDFVPFEPDTDFMKYYPGDDYVDWWALEVFLIEDISRPCTKAFLDAAAQHKKPVILSETTPLHAPETFDSQAWKAWFGPFFDFVAGNPTIKAVCYINWDWRRFDKWAGWGDRRLESNAFLAVRYYREMSRPVWLHASSWQEISGHLHIRKESP